MIKSRNMVVFLVLLVLLIFSVQAAVGGLSSGGLGTNDTNLTGSCQSGSTTYCGKISGVGNCYCDRECTRLADCCSDFQQVCSSILQCTDSDNGEDYYTKGTVIWTTQNYEVSDYCSGTNVVEYFCTGDAYSRKTFACPNGCHDGACLRRVITKADVLDYVAKCTSTSTVATKDEVINYVNSYSCVPPPPVDTGNIGNHTPPPPSSGPVKFQIDDEVVTNQPLYARPTPSLSSEAPVLIPANTNGTILDGPVSADGFNWYEVIYDYGDRATGWSVETGLDKLPPSPELGLDKLPPSPALDLPSSPPVPVGSLIPIQSYDRPYFDLNVPGTGMVFIGGRQGAANKKLKPFKFSFERNPEIKPAFPYTIVFELPPPFTNFQIGKQKGLKIVPGIPDGWPEPTIQGNVVRWDDLNVFPDEEVFFLVPDKGAGAITDPDLGGFFHVRLTVAPSSGAIQVSSSGIAIIPISATRGGGNVHDARTLTGTAPATPTHLENPSLGLDDPLYAPLTFQLGHPGIGNIYDGKGFQFEVETKYCTAGKGFTGSGMITFPVGYVVRPAKVIVGSQWEGMVRVVDEHTISFDTQGKSIQCADGDDFTFNGKFRGAGIQPQIIATVLDATDTANNIRQISTIKQVVVPRLSITGFNTALGGARGGIARAYFNQP